MRQRFRGNGDGIGSGNVWVLLFWSRNKDASMSN